MDLMRIVHHFFEQEKPVASVCHGAEILEAADVIRGKRLATVSKRRFDVEVCGGIFVDKPMVRSGNLVSGRVWHDSPAFMPEFITMLKEVQGREEKRDDE